MTANQLADRRAVIILSCAVGAVMLLVSLLGGRWMWSPFGVIFVVFGLGMLVILHRHAESRPCGDAACRRGRNGGSPMSSRAMAGGSR